MVITTTRSRTMTGTAVLIAAILVLAFGNPAYVDWANRNADPNTAGGFFLRELTWPAWRFTSQNDTGAALRDLLAADIKALLLIALTAALVGGVSGALLASARGSLAAFILGWGCFILAAALAGLLTAFLSSNASVRGAFDWAAGGAVYGLFVGWIVGAAATAARRR